jgi:hypothetical protein
MVTQHAEAVQKAPLINWRYAAFQWVLFSLRKQCVLLLQFSPTLCATSSPPCRQHRHVHVILLCRTLNPSFCPLFNTFLVQIEIFEALQ